MPPKTKVPPARYKTAMAYFKAAYRERIKERPGLNWSNAEINSTLAWLWLHASDAEKQRSRELVESKSQDLPTIDEAAIPIQFKTTQDPAPARAPSDRGGTPSDIDKGEARSTLSKARVNTTAFHYLPDLRKLNDTLPNFENSDDEDGEEEKDAKKRRWLDMGLCYPDKESNGQRWYGAHWLGHGATGRVALWVGSNDNNVIQDRLAVRDVAEFSVDKWINPMHWRDQLPREIAIQVRLNNRKSYNHHIHRYYAHRVNFWQRRYRVFNEICDLGNLSQALEWYSRGWRRRRNMFKWINNNADIAKAGKALDDASMPSGSHEARLKKKLKRANRKAWERVLKRRRQTNSLSAETVEISPENENRPTEDQHNNEDDPLYHEYEAMSGLDEWHDQSLPEKLPEVIPESFLWKIFDQLVDAFTLLGTGRVGEADEEDGEESAAWNEIVHKDVHLMNIFVKPSEEARGGTLVESGPVSSGYRFEQFRAKDAPSVVLADFDCAFFDLQSGEDQYADNPQHYVVRGSASEEPLVGGRYPPEVFWDYEGYKNDDGVLEKMTSKTDVWAIGQIMWNLVMNIPGKDGSLNQPFFHFADENNIMQEQQLVNGKPYDIVQHRDHLFSGITPFEASGQYSGALKNTILLCLDYRQDKRWTFAKLKSVTKRYAERKVPSDSKARGDVVIKVPGEMEKFAVGGAYEWPLDEDGNFKKQRRPEEEGLSENESLGEDSPFGDVDFDNIPLGRG